MNILIEKLHSAARRYCIDKYDYWTKQYSQIAGTGRSRDGRIYTSTELNVFPRYLVLNAILVEIEKFTPQDFSTLDEAKVLISSISGYLANDTFKYSQNGLTAEKAMTEERKAFVNYIQTLSEEEIGEVEPMSYRRVIKRSEKQQIWAELKKVWNIQGGNWYPLSEGNPFNLIAFQAKYLEREVGVELLRSLLMKHGITRVWELREFGPEYEMELVFFDPSYNGAEGYWCTQNMNWIIYASHESSITIGGWLLDDVKSVWPNWKERIWTTPFFE
jgi:hypothetical protein